MVPVGFLSPSVSLLLSLPVFMTGVTHSWMVLCLAGHLLYSLCHLCILALRPATGVGANGPVLCCVSPSWHCFREPWFVYNIEAWYCGKCMSKQFEISWVYYGHLWNEPIILALKSFTISNEWRYISCIFSVRKYLNKFLNCFKVLGIMVISINPHKPLVKAGCGDWNFFF